MAATLQLLTKIISSAAAADDDDDADDVVVCVLGAGVAGDSCNLLPVVDHRRHGDSLTIDSSPLSLDSASNLSPLSDQIGMFVSLLLPTAITTKVVSRKKLEVSER